MLTRTINCHFAIAALLAGVAAFGTVARAGDPLPASDMTKPRDAGIRYGQAAGVAAVCPDLRVTSRAESLGQAFTGKDLEAFNVQAEAVLSSWKKTLTCSHTMDPNPCRLANQMSCQQALQEIGPAGTVAPGLIEAAAQQ